MRGMRSFVRGLALVLALGCVTAVAASAQVPVMRSVMRGKLANAQLLLRAVVMADFQTVERAANGLARISETEIASWQAPGQPAYTEEAMRFVRAVQGLRQAARARDGRAVGAEYTALVSSCVGCHAVVARVRLTSDRTPR